VLFSDRRRHTRFSRDWSSDVCSSDLSAVASKAIETDKAPVPVAAVWPVPARETCPSTVSVPWPSDAFSPVADRTTATDKAPAPEIGRASCRERVEHTEVARQDRKHNA